MVPNAGRVYAPVEAPLLARAATGVKYCRACVIGFQRAYERLARLGIPFGSAVARNAGRAEVIVEVFVGSALAIGRK